jgi:hypothetical protein
MPKKTAIKDYWKGWLVKQEKFDSITEVLEADYCWACGFIGETDKDDWTERAHIQAKIEGGLDAVENLHLLCSACHVSSELLNGQDYFDWFKARTLFDVLRDLQDKNARNASVSVRTKQGLARAKANGVQLGRPKQIANKIVADIIEARTNGQTFESIAADLNAAGIVTVSGKAWTRSVVHSTIVRNGGDPRPAARGPRKKSTLL